MIRKIIKIDTKAIPSGKFIGGSKAEFAGIVAYTVIYSDSDGKLAAIDKACGFFVHEAALERGVKGTGATVHFVNEIPDGGKIIMQKAVNVKDGDTPETLQKRVMRLAEWKILPEAVEKVCADLQK